MNTINQINHKTLNSILKQLKADELKAKAAYFNAEIGDSDEMYLAFDWDDTRNKLDKFRNAKLSDLHMIIKQGELI